MKKLRLGIVGAGGIVKSRHLPGLRKIPDLEFVAVANSSLESSRRFCQAELPEAEPLGDWRDLVARPDLDIVWIGTTPYLHREITLAALAAGRHVFCQARMAMNLAEAESMLAAAEARPDLVTMLCPPPMGLRYDAFFRQLLAEDTGAIRHLRLRSLNSGMLNPDQPPHWRQRREISGYNCMSLGIYLEVLQRWFGTIQAVQAVGKVWTKERHGYRVEIPEQLDVLLEFTSGAVASLAFSGVHQGSPVEELEVTGQRAGLHFDFTRDVITRQQSGQAPETLTVPPERDRPWQVEQDFIASVRHPGNPRPHPTFRDGVAYMRAVEAIHFALREQRRVSLVVPN